MPGVDFSDRRVLAFAGIGRPEKFFATLREAGADLAATRTFADHHPYTTRDTEHLAAEAERLGANLVTTAKDHVRLAPAFAAHVAVLPVSLAFADPTALQEQLRRLVNP